jgi:hypothetical protein
MGRMLVLGVYFAMVVGGVLTLILQLLYSPTISLEFAGGSGMTAVAGAYLLWQDFLR